MHTGEGIGSVSLVQVKQFVRDGGVVMVAADAAELQHLHGFVARSWQTPLALVTALCRVLDTRAEHPDCRDEMAAVLVLLTVASAEQLAGNEQYEHVMRDGEAQRIRVVLLADDEDEQLES